MDSLGPVLFGLLGLFAVGSGLRQVWTLLRMRWFGVRSDGVVLRHKITRHDGTTPMYSAVIGFSDEHGDRREFMNDWRIESARPWPELGSSVRVVHLPGRAETARMDMVWSKSASLAIRFVVGTVFLAVAVASIFGRFLA